MASEETDQLDNLLQNYFSEHLWNLIPNSCSSQCPRASIYRLRWATAVICTDAVRTVNLGRPDRQLCDRIFREFRWKSFLFKSRVRTVRHYRPDGCMSAASNFHIRLRASGSWGKNVWTAILQHAIYISDIRASGPWKVGVRTVEVESAISICVVRASGPRLTDVRTVIFELQFLPYIWARPDGCINLPLFRTWKESKANQSLKGVQTGCWDVRTDASWNKSFSIQYRVWMEKYVVRTVDAWSVERPDGMTRRLDGWTVDRWASGRDGTIV
jgi:hypothetical protein